ncbi:hypothetical protein SDC9_172129 [bioreactor metagenome]|uniref:Uncharacterized protein n=1 Tax=bioreactor metagenome TaxID=1076179 RepID=A0A645GCU9_9ZZZZ
MRKRLRQRLSRDVFHRFRKFVDGEAEPVKSRHEDITHYHKDDEDQRCHEVEITVFIHIKYSPWIFFNFEM